MLQSVLESKEWLIGTDGRIIEVSNQALSGLKNNISVLPKHEKDAFLREQLLTFINALKSN